MVLQGSLAVIGDVLWWLYTTRVWKSFLVFLSPLLIERVCNTYVTQMCFCLCKSVNKCVILVLVVSGVPKDVWTDTICPWLEVSLLLFSLPAPESVFNCNVALCVTCRSRSAASSSCCSARTQRLITWTLSSWPGPVFLMRTQREVRASFKLMCQYTQGPLCACL